MNTRYETRDRRQERAPRIRSISHISYLISLALLLTLGFVLLRRIFTGTIVLDPVAFHRGPVSIRWYGIILAIAIGGAYEWSRRRLIARGVDAATAETICWWAGVGGILGARLGFVVQNLGFYAAHPIEILAFIEGGLSIHGGVIGGALAVWLANHWQAASSKQQAADAKTSSPLTAHRSPLPFLFLADIIAPTVLAATILGRFGNFMNYELYGYPTSVVWKMFVPLQYRLPGYESFSFFHPTFLYELLLNLVMLGIVLRFEHRSTGREHSGSELGNHTPGVKEATLIGSRPGSTFFLTLALYSVSRFAVEFWRIGDDLALGLSLAQWLSLAVIACSLILLTYRRVARYNFIRK